MCSVYCLGNGGTEAEGKTAGFEEAHSTAEPQAEVSDCHGNEGVPHTSTQ